MVAAETTSMRAITIDFAPAFTDTIMLCDKPKLGAAAPRAYCGSGGVKPAAEAGAAAAAAAGWRTWVDSAAMKAGLAAEPRANFTSW